MKSPIRQAGARRGESVQLNQVLLSVRDPAQMRATAEVITSQLEGSHQQKDWEVQVAGERLANS